MPLPETKQRLARMLSTLVIFVGIGMLSYGALLFILQRRMAFPGTELTPDRASINVPPGAEQVWLATSSGRIEAWFFPSGRVAGAPTVVFAHGNYELIDDWYEAMSDLAARGINALAVEYPGYGHSQGSPTRESIREGFALAYDWLVGARGVDGARVVAWGRSIGGGAASDLALDRPVGALVLQSSFSSSMRMAREMFAPGFLVKDRWDNARVVSEFTGPVLILHGESDEVISFEHAEILASARPDLEVTRIPCGHNDCWSAWPTMVATLTTLLREHGLLAADVSASSRS